ncbi:MAG: Hsp20/alpha crystallin family protein [Casimicrobiaceae bacterium]
MNTLQVYAPLADAGFDELFRGFFKPVRAGGGGNGPTIKVDVAEKSDAYVIQAELPGVAKEDIHVTIEGNQVTIAAEVKRVKEYKASENGDKKSEHRALRSERFYGAVHRSFVLPVELDETASEAKFENGVLELKLSKKAPAAGRKLTIQ